MYEAHYSLKFDPFKLSPDHRLCFAHTSFKKAKAYITYALHRAEGFVMITGRPGTGKTTLINELLSGLDESSYCAARLATTQLRGQDFLRAVAYAFKLPAEGLDQATLLRDIERFLVRCHDTGRSALLVVDEAQDLHRSALTELRLLANMQHGSDLLLQAFLVGQEQLATLLGDPEMEQLRQRVIAACHLEPLNASQTQQYVLHRLRKVGWDHNPRLDAEVFTVIHHYSKGIPRQINLIASRLLLHGCVEEKTSLSREDALSVVGELSGEQLGPGSFESALTDPPPLARAGRRPPVAEPAPPCAASPVDAPQAAAPGLPARADDGESGDRHDPQQAALCQGNVRRLRSAAAVVEVVQEGCPQPAGVVGGGAHGHAAVQVAAPEPMPDPARSFDAAPAPRAEVADHPAPASVVEARVTPDFLEAPRYVPEAAGRHSGAWRRVRLALLSLLVLGSAFLAMANQDRLTQLVSNVFEAPSSPHPAAAAGPPAGPEVSLGPHTPRPRPQPAPTVVSAPTTQPTPIPRAEARATGDASAVRPDTAGRAVVAAVPVTDAVVASTATGPAPGEPAADTFDARSASPGATLGAEPAALPATVDGVPAAQPAPGERSQALRSGNNGLALELENYLSEVEHLDERTLKASLGRQLPFAPGLANIEPSAYPLLDRLGETLSRYPDLHIEIVGHTSTAPNRADDAAANLLNVELSRHRAQAVAEYLGKQGLDGAALKFDGRGGLEPRASNDSETGRRLNRRVDLHIRSGRP